MEQQEERDTYLENLDLGGYIYFHDDFTLVINLIIYSASFLIFYFFSKGTHENSY